MIHPLPLSPASYFTSWSILQTPQSTYKQFSKMCCFVSPYLWCFFQLECPVSIHHLSDLQFSFNHSRFSFKITSFINLPSFPPMEVIPHHPHTYFHFRNNFTVLQLKLTYLSPWLKKFSLPPKSLYQFLANSKRLIFLLCLNK